MNLVLADTEEFRRVKRRATKAAAAPGASSNAAPLVESEEKRTLGLTIVRGAHIISLSVESPPPADASARLGASAPGGVAAALAPGSGIARPAGRGAPVGLAVCLSTNPTLSWLLTSTRAPLLGLVVRHLHTEASRVLRRLAEEVRTSSLPETFRANNSQDRLQPFRLTKGKGSHRVDHQVDSLRRGDELDSG
jgi:small nuclear ribonucleoprotein B and B'